MYIVFSPEQKQNRLADLANQFLCEFYSPSVTSGPFLDSLFTLITCEMINLFQHGMVLDHASVDQIYTILRYIETNFADCTLSSTAEFLICTQTISLPTYVSIPEPLTKSWSRHTGSLRRQNC